MAFPTLGTPTSGNSGGNATAHTVTLPTIAAGDRIVIVAANDGADVSAEITTPATGWTKIAGPLDANAGTHSAGLNAWYRDCDGSEAATVTVTTGASEGLAWACGRINAGTFNASTPPAVATNEPASSSATPDPPALDPAAWAAEDTLWLIAYGWDGNVAHSSYPANYTLGQATDRWANTGGCGVAIAGRQLNAASEDPGAGAIASSEQWAALTIGIRPAAGGEAHSTSTIGTGAGTAAIVDTTDRQLAPTGTGAGVLAVVDTTDRQLAPTGTGAGVLAVVIDADHGEEHFTTVTATGSGVGLVAAAHAGQVAPTGTAAGGAVLGLAHAGAVAVTATGSGVAVLDVDVPLSIGISISATGSGTVTTARSTNRQLAITATGSGSALLALPFAGCVVAGVNWDVRGDVGLLPFILDRDELDANPGSELTPQSAADETSLGRMLLRATWRRGPGSVLGPLTTPAAGRGRLSLIDTERLFDPLNTDSPIRDSLVPGVKIRILGGGIPAFTGWLRSWSHDLGSSSSSLELFDSIGRAGAAPLPADGVTLPDATITAQAVAVMSAAAWPAELVDLPGLSTMSMLSIVDELVTLTDRTLLEALNRLRFAELAELSADRTGRLVWRGPGWPHEPDPSALINCGGVILEGLASSIDENRIRNVVRVDGPLAAPSTNKLGTYRVPAAGPVMEDHAVVTNQAALRLIPKATPYGPDALATTFRVVNDTGQAVDRYELEVYSAAGVAMWTPGVVTIAAVSPGLTVAVAYAGTALTIGAAYRWRMRLRTIGGAWSHWIGATFTAGSIDRTIATNDETIGQWAGTILEALGRPSPLTALGTIRPRGWAEVEGVVMAEAGDRWLVVDDHVTPALAIEVRVWGLGVTLAAGASVGDPAILEVDAITEDVAA